MSNIAEILLSSGVNKRSPDGLKAVAAKLKCEAATVQAIVQVESNGSGIDKEGRVKVLFEKHKFYKNLPPEKRSGAVKAGLARATWISAKKGGYKDQPNNAAALDFLVRAIAIDETAALKSASYGAGQVMGENYSLCGWPSVQSFVLDMCETEDSHVEAMMGFLVGNGLADELRARDFDAIERVYNGGGQNGVYANRMRVEYRTFAGKEPKIESVVRESGLRLGSTGYRVEELQKRLNEIGFPVAIDKDFGPTTRNAVKAFQASVSLPDIDGVVGPATQRALDVAVSQIPEARANATVADLREKGSSIIKEADKTQGVGILTTGLAAVGVAEKAGLLDKVTEASTALSALSEPLASVTALIADNWWILAAGAGLALFYYARRIKAARLAGYQSGRIV
jgi:peptidoglycan hydrolase-like protein with peptidoglycan-binding domain